MLCHLHAVGVGLFIDRQVYPALSVDVHLAGCIAVGERDSGNVLEANDIGTDDIAFCIILGIGGHHGILYLFDGGELGIGAKQVGKVPFDQRPRPNLEILWVEGVSNLREGESVGFQTVLVDGDLDV
ncbi:hypothetical protein DSECCO2_526050 [anaerobic digester metagenome]